MSLCDAQIISNVQNALTDHAKESVFGYSLNGEFYNDAMTKLKRRIGRPQVVIAAYLDKLERWPMPSTENPDSFISFAVLLRQLVQEKLSPAIMIVKWDENVIRKELVNPNMIQFKDLIDMYAEACKDMPCTHNKHSFDENTPKRKFRTKIQPQIEVSALSTNTKFKKVSTIFL